MVSEGKAHSVHGGASIGRRIRFLRGELSQAEFAKKIGVSRSAIANYETGRTRPSDDVLREIAEVYGVSEDFLSAGEAKDLAELATALGLGPNSPDTLTKDEWAIVRVLRLMNTDVIAKIALILVNELRDNEDARRLADKLTILEDLARLVTVVEHGGQSYDRGASRGGLDAMMIELARRIDDLKGGPQ